MDVRKKREAKKGEGVREFLARGRHMPVTHRRAQQRGGPTEFVYIIYNTQNQLMQYQNFSGSYEDQSRHITIAVGVTAMLRKTYFIISRTCRGRPRAVAAAASVLRPSFQVLGKNKMGSSRAEEEEEDENMTKMGGNKMDRLRTS